ncbi:hypothetical protein QR680_005370 [Steinernema hermaphroditum]|uniref:Uncharacterized protein n=1 Tax=Steinernema hermaphroditum TaxID=289476 RepID=A0AA39LV87_9BILA|nr:hypothetical protein QR680_005370 [Steinernema hermaphroditum]
MLFLNSRPVDTEATESGHLEDIAKKDHKKGIVLASIAIYFLLSAILSLSHLPISAVVLAIPLMALVHALVVVKCQKTDLVWPCVFLGALGGLVKLASIVVYVSFFDLFEQSHSKRGVLKPRHAEDGTRDHPKHIFFGVLLSVEVAVVLVSCCLQWHLLAFRSCPSKSRKQPM